MQVSVIIPVYNATRYLQQAVESALAHPEVIEVILVDDGSGDDSLLVCQTLAERPYIKVYQHPNAENRGASATRHLGVIMATAPWVTLGWHFENETARQRWIQSRRKPHKLMTIKEPLAPEHLFEVLMLGTSGSFSLDGLIVKREALLKIGGFEPVLRSGQDNLLKIKLAFHCQLLPGELNQAVTMARVHSSNNVSGVLRPNEHIETDLYFQKFWEWGQQSMDTDQQCLLRKYFARYVMLSRRGWLEKRYRLTRLLLRWPRLGLYRYF